MIQKLQNIKTIEHKKIIKIKTWKSDEDKL